MSDQPPDTSGGYPPSSLGAAPPPASDYPIQYWVDYPERPLNRLTTGLRIFTAIPIVILIATVSGGTYAAGGLLFFGPLLMILFRQKYPRWWFDWNRELLRFQNRVGVYVALMDDRYPSSDEQQSVHLEFEHPDAAHELNRWLPLVLFDYLVGVGRWHNRVEGYALLLVTDRYPPFRLAP